MNCDHTNGAVDPVNPFSGRCCICDTQVLLPRLQAQVSEQETIRTYGKLAGELKAERDEARAQLAAVTKERNDLKKMIEVHNQATHDATEREIVVTEKLIKAQKIIKVLEKSINWYSEPDNCGCGMEYIKGRPEKYWCSACAALMDVEEIRSKK